jgi:hypothetical protein
MIFLVLNAEKNIRRKSPPPFPFHKETGIQVVLNPNEVKYLDSQLSWGRHLFPGKEAISRGEGSGVKEYPQRGERRRATLADFYFQLLDYQ